MYSYVSCYQLVSSSLSWGTLFSIFYKVGLLVINSLSFYMRMSLLPLHFWKIGFLCILFLVDIFFFQVLENIISLPPALKSFCRKKSTDHFMGAHMSLTTCFSLAAFKILSLTFGHLILIFLDMVSLDSSYLVSFGFPRSGFLSPFSTLGSLLLFFLNQFSVSSVFSSGMRIMYVFFHLMVSHKSHK